MSDKVRLLHLHNAIAGLRFYHLPVFSWTAEQLQGVHPETLRTSMEAHAEYLREHMLGGPSSPEIIELATFISGTVCARNAFASALNLEKAGLILVVNIGADILKRVPHAKFMKEMEEHAFSTIMELRMTGSTKDTYIPYCANQTCSIGRPLTKFVGGQFACGCSWASELDSEYIDAYQRLGD